ncbi:SDR family NAD(P)-dependent oxidoreductase [Corynebacterium sp. sy039]|uniref:SDR family NAD(P)-dependent oxidoreductase n=1 Tax=Corynebacterium sp. sy039 TaxID=2599641 RepID=UPI0011B4F0BD|nr:SDR family oxidoreductase [Corynebacterium sp. sy039]QDZ42850.1 SDR family oxidoreductase [Corynebacterium sp. sy039]
MELALRNKTALITGGSKGLGYAAAVALVQEGARVVVCARHEDEVKQAVARLNELSADSAIGVCTDISDPDNIKHLLDDVAQNYGSLDILVNNAGGAHPGTPETLTDQAFLADFNIKVLSWQRMIKASLPLLRKSHQARIINISSVYAHTPDPAFFATSVLRAAGDNFTKTWAAALAKEGVLVNSINIGVIETPQWENIRNKRAPEKSLDEFFADTVARDIPLGRIGQAAELGSVVAFLASSQSSYITGSSIDVAGGMGLRF